MLVAVEALPGIAPGLTGLVALGVAAMATTPGLVAREPTALAVEAEADRPEGLAAQAS